MAPLGMLALDPAGWFAFGPVKWLVVTVALLTGAARRLRAHPVRMPRRLGWLAAAFLGWLSVCAVVGADPVYAWVGTPERHLGVLTWGLLVLALVVGTTMTVTRDGPTLAAGLGVAGLGVGATAAAEALGWEPLVFQAGDRLSGTFGSAAFLGAAAALLLPACVGAAADRALPARTRVLSAAALPLLLVALVGSGARAAWLGTAVATLVVAWSQRAWLRAHGRLAGWAGAALVAAGGLVLLVTPMGGRLADLTDPDAPGGRGRLDEWRVATRAIADHPVTGVGPEGYRIEFGAAVDAAYERAHGREQQPDRAHSGPLDLALAGGLPGLALWGALLAVVGRAVCAALRSGHTVVVGLGAALVAHWVGQLLLFPVAEIEPLAWLLAGLLVAAAPAPDGPRQVVPRAVPAALGVLAVVALVAGVTDVVADRRAADAVAALERGDAATAVASAERARDLRPDVVRLHVLAAAALVADERGTVAGIAALGDALAVSPGDPIVLLGRAGLLVDRAEATQVPSHVDRARREVEGLLRSDPHSAALWRLAGRVAQLEGDRAAAADATARADDLTPPPAP